MNVKDFNIFNLSLQQKKLLKKKVGQGGDKDKEESKNLYTPKDDFNIHVKITFTDSNTYAIKFTPVIGYFILGEVNYDNLAYITPSDLESEEIDAFNFRKGIFGKKCYVNIDNTLFTLGYISTLNIASKTLSLKFYKGDTFYNCTLTPNYETNMYEITGISNTPIE